MHVLSVLYSCALWKCALPFRNECTDIDTARGKHVVSLYKREKLAGNSWHALRAAGEMLHVAEPFLERSLHPTVIIRGYVRALEDALKIVDGLAFPIDTSDREQMLKIIASCIGTKFTSRFGTLMPVRPSTCVSRVGM